MFNNVPKGVQLIKMWLKFKFSPPPWHRLHPLTVSFHEFFSKSPHVYLWQIHFDIWQNQYNILKFKNKIKKKKKRVHSERNLTVVVKLSRVTYCEPSSRKFTPWGRETHFASFWSLYLFYLYPKQKPKLIKYLKIINIT